MSCLMCRRWSAETDLQIAEFNHSYLMLNRDQYFPGYCFLLSKEHVTELFHLTPEVRRDLIEEVNRAAKVLADLFKADKINYELLGNMVPHMHWHLVPRFVEDALWPRPIWSEPHAELVLEAAEYRERIALIRTALGVT
jgi:diadenosine tetraphosphate (Ap4A) HIT family hydrolase